MVEDPSDPLARMRALERDRWARQLQRLEAVLATDEPPSGEVVEPLAVLRAVAERSVAGGSGWRDGLRAWHRRFVHDEAMRDVAKLRAALEGRAPSALGEGDVARFEGRSPAEIRAILARDEAVHIASNARVYAVRLAEAASDPRLRWQHLRRTQRWLLRLGRELDEVGARLDVDPDAFALELLLAALDGGADPTAALIAALDRSMAELSS